MRFYSFLGFISVFSILFAGCTVTSDTNEEENLSHQEWQSSAKGCELYALKENKLVVEGSKMTNEKWLEIFDSFDKDVPLNAPIVQEKLAYLKKHPKFMVRILNNAEPYIYDIFTEAKKLNVPAEVVIIPMIESHYNPKAISKAGPAGMWQFIVSTAKNFGLRVDKTVDERMDPKKSSAAAIGYMSYLIKFFNRDWKLAIAGYNAGEGRIKKLYEQKSKTTKNVAYSNLDLPPITRQYIYTVFAYTYYLRNWKSNNLVLPISNNIDLSKAITEEETKYFSSLDDVFSYKRISFRDTPYNSSRITEVNEKEKNICYLHLDYKKAEQTPEILDEKEVAKLEQVKDKNESKDKNQVKEKEQSKDKNQVKEKEQSKDKNQVKEKEQSKDKNQVKEKEQSKDKNQVKEKEQSKDKNQVKEKEQSKDKNQVKEKEQSKDKNQVKEKEQSKDKNQVKDKVQSKGKEQVKNKDQVKNNEKAKNNKQVKNKRQVNNKKQVKNKQQVNNKKQVKNKQQVNNKKQVKNKQQVNNKKQVKNKQQVNNKKTSKK